MLIEMIVIFFPVTLVTIVSAPFVVMVSLIVPPQISNILLGITFCLSCSALVASWGLALRFWRHGTAHLKTASTAYVVLATIGALIAVIACGMAFFGHATGFLFGTPLLIPYLHLLYELRTSNINTAPIEKEPSKNIHQD